MVFFLPQTINPGTPQLALLAVALEKANWFGNVSTLDQHVYLFALAFQKLPEARYAFGIDDGDIQHFVQLIIEPAQHITQPPYARLEEMVEIRVLAFPFVWGKSCSFQEVQHAGRMILETLAGFERRSFVSTFELRIFADLALAGSLDVREAQQPQCGPQKRNPKQLLFGEKFQWGDVPEQIGLQQQDVAPALMIAHHYVPVFERQRFSVLPGNIYFGQREHPDQPSVGTYPGVDNPVHSVAEWGFQSLRQYWTDYSRNEQR